MVTAGASPWAVLALPHDASVADVRSRYAALVKQYRPDTHPDDFARIREAYEQVLRHARLREQGASTPEPQADEPGNAPAAERPAVAKPEAEVTVEVEVEATPQRPPLPALVPLLQAQVQAEGEAAALPALRRLLDDSKRVSLDERQALEFALLQWFLRAQSPPLLLMFDAARAFGWHGAAGQLAGWIGPAAAHQLELLLALARDEVFARHRAGNRWLRRLFEPGSAAPWVGINTPMAEALAWAARWRHAAEQTGLPALAQRMNPRVIRRLTGGVVWSTDGWVAMLASLPFTLSWADASTSSSPLWLACVFLPSLLVAPLIAALRIACGRVRRLVREAPPESRLGRLVGGLRAHPRLAVYGSIAAAVALVAIALAFDLHWLLAACASVGLFAVLAGVGGFVLCVLWWLALVVERIAFVPWHWREAVDRWEMAQLLKAAPEPATAHDPPFGRRLRWWQRLGKLGAARRLQKEELQRHERPPRANPPQIVRPAERPKSSWGDRTSPRFSWWWVWLILIVLRGIASIHN